MAKLSEEYPSWIPPREALDQLGSYGSSDLRFATVERLKHGLLSAIARHCTYEGRKAEYVPVPTEAWETLGNHAHLSSVWAQGDFKATIRSGRPSSSYGSEMALFGVRFDPEGIREFAESRGMAKPKAPAAPAEPAAPVAAPPSATPPAAKGGRPAKDWWDECWVAIFGQIYRGDLKPKNQAGIENAMADWAHAHGHDASEQSFRTRARLLWAVVKEDKN